ncbi:MAG: hypothetical protein HEP71_29185 [Roseivirga sp.]|nr:hypothetical protein [Roseivirga sp.]
MTITDVKPISLIILYLGMISSGGLVQAQSDQPSPRNQPVMIYADHIGGAVLFGGFVNGKRTNDTWLWNGSWRQLITENAPPVRSGHSMTYDTLRKKIVLFGGRGVDSLLNDTWTFDGEDWRQIKTEGPPARQSHRLEYDQSRRKTVLFGGSGADRNSLSDTWLFNGRKWEQLETEIPGRLQHAMSYNPERRSIILFGGFSRLDGEKTVLADTWEYKAKTWRKMRAEGPVGRDHHAMAFDPTSQSTLLFGGYREGYLGDTWQLVKGTWRIFTPNGPNRAGKPTIFYDKISAQLIMYGGWDSGNKPLTDFWIFDLRWKQSN